MRPGPRPAPLLYYDALALDADPLNWRVPKKEALRLVDEIVRYYLRTRKDTDTLLAVVCPEQPYYANPEVQKSMGPVILYETKRPRHGLLYTDLTRWPGVITASDFAPTVLNWWGIPDDPSMEGHVLQVRPGGPADLDRLDREMTDHYRWSFTAIPAEMAFAVALLGLGLAAALWRPGWFRYLGIPSLAFPLVPIGYLLAHIGGVSSLPALLAFGFAVGLLHRGSRARPLLRNSRPPSR